MKKYKDRQEAGQRLAGLLNQYKLCANALVFALPRGGVPVAFEIAKALSLPLDVFLVRKLGVPFHNELAMGALASGGTVIFNQDVIRSLHVDEATIKQVIEAEQQELLRREHLYRGHRPFPEVAGKRVILVDDGIATGATMRAAVAAIKALHPEGIVIAVPVGTPSICDALAASVAELVCPLRPADLYAVGLWYEYFTQTDDEEVIHLLAKI